MAHLYVYDSDREGKRKRCNIIPMCCNYWLAPSHMFEEEKQYTVEVQTTDRTRLGKNFTQLVAPELWYRIPESDFILLCLSSGGDVPDFARFLPTDDHDFTGTHVDGLWKDEDGSTLCDSFELLKEQDVQSATASFRGLIYNYPRPKFHGLCTMVLIT
eukprot:338400_1